MPPVLVIFLRKPELGKVKTRLAASIGDENALAVYRELIDRTMKVVMSFPGVKQAWYSAPPDDADLETVTGCSVHQQCEGDLGERMFHALDQAAATGDGPVMIIGTDCPDLGPELLKDALDALDLHDAVIGPAKDGGYYLLGMRTVHASLFQNKVWSTSSVAECTMDDLRAAGYTFHVLPTLMDVDTLEDLRSYPELMPSNGPGLEVEFRQQDA